MTDNFGGHLSSLLGGNTESSKATDEKKTVHKSPTTNSYNKCIDSLTGHFTSEQIALARKAIDKHDQNSFEERVKLGEAFMEEDGVRRKVHEKMLIVKGTYKNALFAHLKTIEMWIENIPCNIIAAASAPASSGAQGMCGLCQKLCAQDVLTKNGGLFCENCHKLVLIARRQ